MAKNLHGEGNMICKFCNCENSDDSIYCKKCGKNLNQKNLCPRCGVENDFDALFCKRCGTALSDDANTVTRVAEEYQTPVTEALPIAQVGTTVANARPMWKKALEIVGAAFLMTALFFTLLFTFFVGINVKLSGGSPDSVAYITGQVGVNLNLYYFFGQAYKDIDAALSATQSYDVNGCYWATEYIPAVMGTIVAVGLIVSVVALAAVSIVRFVAHFRGAKSKSFVNPIITAFALLLIGSVALVAMYHSSVSLVSDGQKVSAAIVPNGETIGGLVAAGVCIGIFVACSFAVRGKDFCKKQNILALVFTLITVVVSAVLLAFAAKGAISVKEGDLYDSESYCISLMTFVANFYLVQSFADSSALIVATLCLVAQIALVVLVSLCLRSQLIRATEGRSKPLALSIVAFALACVYLVLAVVLVHVTAANDSELKLMFTAPIVALVFSALLMGTCITQSALNRPVKTSE